MKIQSLFRKSLSIDVFYLCFVDVMCVRRLARKNLSLMIIVFQTRPSKMTGEIELKKKKKKKVLVEAGIHGILS